jgi:hypothetical protein
MRDTSSPSLNANYYEKLTKVFLMSGNALSNYHAAVSSITVLPSRLVLYIHSNY